MTVTVKQACRIRRLSLQLFRTVHQGICLFSGSSAVSSTEQGTSLKNPIRGGDLGISWLRARREGSDLGPVQPG